MDEYVRGKVLGKGSFGSAILVTSKKDGKNYVIKEIDISRMPAAEREASKQEARLLMALKHPNIVRCMDSFTHTNKLCIVMEWCSEGDLYGLLQKRKSQQLPEDTVLDWFVQICLGLKHVHDRKILHRDLKTQNVFVSSGGLLKLGDFGVSKILASTWQLAATAVGTPYYLSPEICQNKKYNQKSDIWSLGCVLYELTTLKHAFEALNMRALIQKIIVGTYPPVPSTRSKGLRELIDRMLTLDVNKRPNINEVLSTPIMKARIQKFLSATLQAHEFSHTVIHGKPKPGQCVVGHAAATPAAPPSDAAAAAAAAAKRPTPATPAAAAASPSAARNPSAAVQRPAVGSPAAAASPSALPPKAGGGAAPAVAAPSPGKAAVRPSGSASPGGKQAAASAGKGASPSGSRPGSREEDAAVKAAAAEKRGAGSAAAAAAEARAKAADEQRKREQQDSERRQREVDAMRRKVEEEARRRELDKQDKEREAARALAAAQKREYAERQAAAARNRAAAEEQLRGPPPEPRPRRQWQDVEVEAPSDAGRDKPARGGVELTPEQRRAVWEEQQAAVRRNKAAAAGDGDGGAGGRGAAGRGGGLAAFLGVPGEEEEAGSAGQRGREAGGREVQRGGSGREQERASSAERRRIYAEQRAAAERNRKQVEGERERDRRQWAPQPDREARNGDGLSQAERDRDYYERKQRKLEAERAEREAEIRAFQRAHYREMKEAAERNRRQIMGEIADAQGPAGGSERAPAGAEDASKRRQGSGREGSTAAAAAGAPPEAQDADGEEFAAMVKDMRDILLATQEEEELAAAGGRPEEEEEEEGDREVGQAAGARLGAAAPMEVEEEEEDDGQLELLNGRFMLNGEAVQLPVRSEDPLGVKVEALRMFLEDKLGGDAFLKVYRRLESLTAEDDEALVSQEFMSALGPERLCYVHLVHQLIVCEETWAQAGH